MSILQSALCQNNPNSNDAFEQLSTLLPTPNQYRAADGSPGQQYWQQKADYKIDIHLNTFNQTVSGKESITYTNNSPDTLRYLWVQLDQNVRQKKGNEAVLKKDNLLNSNSIIGKNFNYDLYDTSNYGYAIEQVTDVFGHSIPYTINQTMMRIDPAAPLSPGSSMQFLINWHYKTYDRMVLDGRGGYEYFPDTEDYLYTIAQFYPRMAVYDDYEGWQNKQFLGRGEFALTFGDFDVNITVPTDYIVAATGTLQNPKKVLSQKQYLTYKKASSSFKKQVFIVTKTDVKQKLKEDHQKKEQTWHFKAHNVRDFAFAASRKFIWDAQAVKINNNTVMAYSFYPPEGNPLWEKESTKAVKYTLEYYSDKTIPYPYPQASSVHTANQGMEYPMICFNYGRPGKGRPAKKVRQDMISVVVHEVGHNFFPMIVNSDERQWTWMDEGLNSFLERETMRRKYPKSYKFDLEWGSALGTIDYMKLSPQQSRPIMTNSENILHFGYNAYGKPAAALTVLREVVMGEKLFDHAFKTYAQRWAFKHPKPADFFRTMEDASGVDLDWFWRGWFYTVDYVDLSLDRVQWFKTDNSATDLDTPDSKTISTSDLKPQLLTVESSPSQYYGEFMNRIDQKAVPKDLSKYNIYELTISNKGKLPTPILLRWMYEDGTTEDEKIPAEIWRKSNHSITKPFFKLKKIKKIIIDPNHLTGDIDADNGQFPPIPSKSDYKKFKNNK